jgi:hypothetical protein
VLDIACEIYDKSELFRRLKKFNIALPHNDKYFNVRYIELKKRGLTRSRKDAKQRREIRKEMEECLH